MAGQEKEARHSENQKMILAQKCYLYRITCHDLYVVEVDVPPRLLR